MTTTIHIINPDKEEYISEAILDSAAEVSFISQHMALQWNLPKVHGTPGEAELANGVGTHVYGAYRMSFDVKDSFGQQKHILCNFWGIDRTDHRPIIGMNVLKSMRILLFPPTSEFRFAAKSDKFEIISPKDLKKDIERGACVYTLLCFHKDSLSTPCVADISMLIDGRDGRVDSPPLDNEQLSPLPPELAPEDYEDVFWSQKSDQTPCEGVEHAIETIGDPPFGPIYNLSAPELAELRQYLDDNLAKGWIQESISPAGSPIMFVPKKDGGLRLCVDYRGLNAVTIKNRHPLPLISEILDRLGGSTYFTKIDLKDAYHRIPVKPSDQWKTAFRTRYGHFEYTVMPFGLTNAPATFQAYIHRALAGLLDTICIVYLDDILIFSKDRVTHASDVRTVLSRLREYRLYANQKKCEFFTDHVEYLGYIISSAGVSMDKSRVESIAEWPQPASYHDVQVFLGFANFYRRFIEGYARVASPLSSLLKGSHNGKKSGPFIWNQDADVAFRRLRECFTQASLLIHHDPNKPIRLMTDASGFALGAILLQPNEEGHWLPVAYWSRKMIDAETRYHTHDQELLAIVEAILHWRHYLEGTRYAFEVLTDHKNLKGFVNQKSLSGRQARWAIILAPYDFTIKHHPGKNNPADAPSRRPDYAGVEHEVNDLLHTLQTKLCLSEDDLLDGSTPAQVATLAGMVREEEPQRTHKTWGQHGHAEGYYEEDEDVRALQAELMSQFVPRALVNAIARPQIESQLGVEPSEPLLSLLRMCQSMDEYSQKQREALKPSDSRRPPKNWSVDARELLLYKSRVYVPKQHAIRKELLRVCHDDPFAGHFGATRTLELLQRHFHWEKMEAEATAYVKSCDVCQKTKAKRHLPYGELQPLPRPHRPYAEITFDFITGLPPSRRGASVYDAILVIVDRYTKHATYIPTTKTVTAKGLASLFTDEILRHYGTPEGIVSDRGSVFVSEFWFEFCKSIAATRRLSTAFHPQTDGQTERQNQTLKQYLQAFAEEEQSNWAAFLHVAEFAYNDSKNSTLGVTPFEALMGYRPTFQYHIARETHDSDPPEAAQRIKKICELRETLMKRWESAVETQARSYNRHHKPIAFAPGDMVLLSTQNLKLKLPSKKLAPRFIGPFMVADAVGKQAYRLHLPTDYHIHNVFNVSRLEPYVRRVGEDLPERPKSIILDDGEEQWEVETILGKRKRSGITQYLIRWLGWGLEYDSWVPEDEANCPELITAYEEANKRPARGKKKAHK
jgi:RNase H-like domain found in reverse transcriptase/Reverse transcriptase (RNA-dependent DNA polymerase)/Integrase zinc binding domain/Chromo (CHRromatin Organisation MOdifier) domain